MSKSATEIIELLEEVDGWRVDDWKHVIEKDEDDTLTITLESFGPVTVVETGASEQREQIKAVKDVTRALEAEFEEGAPIDDTVEQAAERLDCEERAVQQQLKQLRRRGEIYEPTQGYIRTT